MDINNSEMSFEETISSLKRMFKFFISKIFIIVLAAFLFSLTGFFYSWYKGPVYRATLNFVSENSNTDGLSGYAGIASQFGIDIGGGRGGAFEGDNLIEVLKSRRLVCNTLLSPISDKDTTRLLIELYIYNHFKGAALDSIKSINFVSNKGVPNRRVDSILNGIYNQIVKGGGLVIEKKDKKLNFILLTFDDKNEIFAKLFVEKLASNAIAFFTEYKTKKATNNLHLLENQCDSLRGLLHQNLNGVAEISDLNVNPLKQIIKSDVQKKQIDVQTSTVMYSELLKQYALAKVSLQKETPLIQIIDSPVLPLKKVNLGKLATAIISGILGFVLILIYYLMRWFINSKREVI